MGFSSLGLACNAQAETFSISVIDGTFSYSDDVYGDTGYVETPVYIVNNTWPSPHDHYGRHHDRKHWRHEKHRGHKKYWHHNDRYHRHHR